MSTDLTLPAKFLLAWASEASSGNVHTIPTDDPGTGLGLASLQLGFPPITFEPVGSGGIPPWGQDANGILLQITQWLQWVQAGGPVQYDSDYSAAIGGYPIGTTLAVVGAPGQLWINTVDGNTTDPDTGGAGWIPATVPHTFYNDSGSANALVITPMAQPAAIVPGMRYQIKVAAGNTGATTLQIGGLSAVNLVDQNGAALTAGMLTAGNIIDVMAVSSSTFQWLGAPPAVTYINAAPAGSVAGNMLVPVWNPTTGRNEHVSISDIASLITAQGVLLPYFLGNGF